MNTFPRGHEGPRSEPESTISPEGMPTYRVEHNAVLRNAGNAHSRQLAITAMCFHCMGCAEDHYEYGVKDDIRKCQSLKCPLWNFRPYKQGEGS